MEDNQDQTLGQRWQEYQPTKTQTFWACVACVVATIIIGFAWGGWVTGGTAREMVENAAEEARLELAAAVCVDEFMAAADARTQLAELQDITSSYRRGEFLEEAGWGIIPGTEEVDDEVADLCARQLAELELPPVKEAATVPDGATVAQ